MRRVILFCSASICLLVAICVGVSFLATSGLVAEGEYRTYVVDIILLKGKIGFRFCDGPADFSTPILKYGLDKRIDLLNGYTHERSGGLLGITSYHVHNSATQIGNGPQVVNKTYATAVAIHPVTSLIVLPLLSVLLCVWARRMPKMKQRSRVGFPMTT